MKTNDLANYISEDWSRFKVNQDLQAIFNNVGAKIKEMLSEVARQNISETTSSIIKEYKQEYADLSPLAKYEFNEAIELITITNPTASQESISLAIETIINLEKPETVFNCLTELLPFLMMT